MKTLEQNKTTVTHVHTSLLFDACRPSPVPLKSSQKGLQLPESILGGPHYVVFANSEPLEAGS